MWTAKRRSVGVISCLQGNSRSSMAERTEEEVVFVGNTERTNKHSPRNDFCFLLLFLLL